MNKKLGQELRKKINNRVHHLKTMKVNSMGFYDESIPVDDSITQESTGNNTKRNKQK